MAAAQRSRGLSLLGERTCGFHAQTAAADLSLSQPARETWPELDHATAANESAAGVRLLCDVNRSVVSHTAGFDPDQELSLAVAPRGLCCLLDRIGVGGGVTYWTSPKTADAEAKLQPLQKISDHSGKDL